MRKSAAVETTQSLRDNKCYNSYLRESKIMTISMCDKCSIQTNKEAWAKYPEMLDLCKMCKSFQTAINNTIDEQAEKLGIATNLSKRLKGTKNGHIR